MFDLSLSGWVLLLASVFVVLPVAYYTFLAVSWLRRMREIGKEVDKLPGPKKHWLYGNLHEHPGPTDAGMRWLMGYMKQHPRAMRIWYGPRPVAVVYHPDTVKAALRTSLPKPVSIGGGYSLFTTWLGDDSLLLSSGSSWFHKRKLLNPSFSTEAVKPFLGIFNQAADTLVEKFDATVGTGSIDVCMPVTLCTFDVLLKASFSSDLNIQREGDTIPYVNATLNMAEMATARFFTPMLFIDAYYYRTKAGKQFQKYMDLCHGVSEKFIAERRMKLKAHPSDYKDNPKQLDFLDLMMLARDEDGRGLTDFDIRQQVDTFLFAGHDTTAASLSWVLYELSRNPEHLHRCQEEIDRVMGDPSAMVDLKWDDLSELTYTTMCLKESMRIHPAVPIIQRETDKPFELDGVTLPPGTFIDIVIYLLHHNEAVWGTDHWEFKPERFHPDKIGQMDPFAFVPFAAGPRNCLGQHFAMNELKVLLAKLLHKFDLHVDQDHPIEHVLCTVMKAKHGIKIEFTGRV